MTPKCIGIIMDGNRRWAKGNNLPTLEGHRRGYAKMKEVAEWAKEAGIGTLIFYAFSTENWKRSQEEVSYLMDLFRLILREEVEEYKKRGIKITVIGEKKSLPEDIQKDVIRAEEETKNLTDLHIVLAISYGGRSEILSATKEIIKENIKEEDINEEVFKNHLWTKGVPDPDIILRTSGEQRLSNFLPWQGVYSELFFASKHWPDFSKEDFLNVLAEYSERDRRHGK